MIYAKIDIEGLVTEYPLTENTVRSRNLETSLPMVIDETSLPYGYILVKTSDNFDIKEKFKDDIEDFIPVKDKRAKVYTIDLTLAELEGIEKGSPEEVEFSLLKRDKLIELSKNVDRIVKELTKDYKVPEVEVKSWEQQLQEALAWRQDINTETPLLNQIAIQRDLDPNLLKQKVLQKADFYRKLTGFIIGRKQKLEDIIENIDNIEELKLTKTEISLEEVTNFLSKTY